MAVCEARRLLRFPAPLVWGTIPEIGAGSGANFVHYDSASVRKLYALEPNPGTIRLAERERVRLKLDVEFLNCPGERMPLEGGSVDAIVSEFTSCTIANVEDAIREIGRVLKPGGKLILSLLMPTTRPELTPDST